MNYNGRITGCLNKINEAAKGLLRIYHNERVLNI